MEFQIGGRKVSLRESQPGAFKLVVDVRMQKVLNKPSQIHLMAMVFIQPSQKTSPVQEARIALHSQKAQDSEDLHKVLKQYAPLFEAPTALPPHRAHDHKIILKEGASPINVRPYRYPASQKDEIEKTIAEMLKSGVIRPSVSSFSSPIVMVKRKGGT